MLPRARLGALLLAALWMSGCQCGRESLPAPTRAPAAPQWIALPGGTFVMGRDGGDDDEAPAHRVRLAPFELMRTEVTVEQYGVCVAAGRCSAPGGGDRCTWGNPAKRAHPVTCITWDDAARFCAWAGGRLPSEAEWEHAAASARGWPYPWGQRRPDCENAVMPDGRGPGCGTGGPSPPCSRPRGSSAQGICDLAGNVWEWVADCWHKTYEGAPASGRAWMEGCKPKERRVVRGSSFLNGTPDDLRAASRDSSPSFERYFSIGFRCARESGFES